jgi:class 3 adenylate cyclase/tetratricopeptide (TPR) repeat protein
LFADVKGSLELVTDRDPEEARRLLDPILERMMAAVHRYGGTVNQVMGDGIMALFGAPIGHEDHALRGCFAALRMQDSITRWSEELGRKARSPIEIRIGLDSGEVIVRTIDNDVHFDYSAVGPTASLAARMEQMAAPGTILLTADVVRLAGACIEVRPLGLVPIKGLKGSREVFELHAITPGTRFAVRATGGLTRFVGRAAELDTLGWALNQAGQGHGQLVALIGEAGVGKSRVVWELIQLARGWRVLTASAASYAKETVHFVVIELLKCYFGIAEGDDGPAIRQLVTARMPALGPGLADEVEPILALLEALPADSAFRRLEAGERRRRTLESVKTLLVRASRDQPLILVLEDLQWMDSASQAFLDSLIEGLPGAHLLIAATFRPEYQPGWTGTKHCTLLRIGRLSSELGRDLLDTLLGGQPDLEPLKEFLIDRCEGNPFFLEETVKVLLEERVLHGAPGALHLAQPVRSVKIPASVQAVLTARIDRLAPDDKALLQSASVIGREVPCALLQLITERTESQVREGLARLRESEFLYEVDPSPEPLHVFKHALTHEVAYGGMLRERRRALHARVVEAIERRRPDRLSDQVERLAHHAQKGEAWGKAIDYLRMAGAQAYIRGALEEAIERYETALGIVARLPAGPDAARRSIDLRLDLHAPLMTVGHTKRISELYLDAERLARELGDTARLGHVLQRISQAAWLGGRYRSGAEYARQALAVAETADDAVTRLHANYFLGLHRHALGDYQGAIPCFAYLVEGPHASLASRIISVTIPMEVPGWCWLAFASVMTGDLGRAEAALRRAVDSAEASEFPQARVIARTVEAVVLAYAGRGASCIPTLEAAVQLCEQIRFVVWLAAAYSTLGLVLARAGKPASALPYLERSVALNERTGVRTYQAQRLSWLAEGLFRVGRLDDALARAAAAVEMARAMEERGVEAEALMIQGLVSRGLEKYEDARTLIEHSLALSAALGARLLQAHGHLGLADVLEGTGDADAGRRAREMANGVFSETGARSWWPVA